MRIVEQDARESWRSYTKRIAKLNQTTRRSVVRWFKRRH
jgi:hypothetical protein